MSTKYSHFLVFLNEKLEKNVNKHSNTHNNNNNKLVKTYFIYQKVTLLKVRKKKYATYFISDRK